MRKSLLKRFILVIVVLAIAIPGGLIYRQYQHERSLAYSRISTGGKVIDTPCGQIQYTEFGEGDPMLIVHGAGGGYDQGEYFAKLIGGDYRWIAPSRFGFLEQPIPGGADSSLQADAYACLLDSLGIDRVGVIGVSMGGPSSLLFAYRYPERTKSLVMISAASHAIPPRSAILTAIFDVFQNDFIFWSMLRLTPEGLLAALGVPMDVQNQLSSKDTAQVHAFLESILPMGARRNGQLLEQHMSETDVEQIRNIQASTLVVHARDDTLVSFDQGEFTAKNVPGAQLLPVETGGHLALMFDINAGVIEKILDFVDLYSRR
jgi:2-hydroxy-6-oxonona-2,4-dienedioate hydrolase